ncbi:MAG: hypothetical protein RSC93_06150 [Erysipelotrichaceae bacterium]
MYQVFNTKLLNSKQRFYYGFFFGFLASIGCAVLYAVFENTLHIRFSILYAAMGYAISMVIQKYGRGVQKKYSIMGACLTAFSIILSMIFIYSPYEFNILFHPAMWSVSIQMIMSIYFNLTTNTILMILFQGVGIYIGYVNSRVV